MPDRIMYLKILLFIALIRRLIHTREIKFPIFSAVPAVKDRLFPNLKNLTIH